MKQLTKEQHEAICQWLNKNKVTITEVSENGTTDTYFLSHKFRQDFEPCCCDSCADGEHCESEPITISVEDFQTTLKKVNDIIEANRI